MLNGESLNSLDLMHDGKERIRPQSFTTNLGPVAISTNK